MLPLDMHSPEGAILASSLRLDVSFARLRGLRIFLTPTLFFFCATANPFRRPLRLIVGYFCRPMFGAPGRRKRVESYAGFLDSSCLVVAFYSGE